MSKPIIPPFLRLLDLMIGAFHLDEPDPEEDSTDPRTRLHSHGTFQKYLTGRSLDLSDDKLDALLLTFSKSLLRAGVFPALRVTLRAELPPPSPLVRKYLGAATSLPRPCGDLAQGMARRLKWLYWAAEDLLGQSRAQVPASSFEPRYALQPLLRFVGHHLTIALAATHACAQLDLEKLPGTLATSWCMAAPDQTPLSAAANALGLSQARVAELLAAHGGVADDKTIANLWHGGPDHPQLGTLCAVLETLYPGSESKQTSALPHWRRWYGMRHMGRAMAELWGWDVVGGMVGDVVYGAKYGAALLAESSLTTKERNGIASYAVWAGWHLGFGRWMFDRALNRAKYDLSPIVRDDYLAISKGREALRLLQCLQIASGGSALEAELIRRGKDEACARSEALGITFSMQSDCPELVGMDPLYDFHFAMAKEDLARAEAAARALVDRRPDIAGNHGYLVAVLTVQDKFDEALAACQNALTLHPEDLHLVQRHANTLMDRGHERRSWADFVAARDLLATPRLRDQWGAQLDLADCYFALGDWASAQAACDRCIKLHDECGEAFALDSICAARLGDLKRANQSAKYATRRGAARFLAWLNELDRRGGLGGRACLPPTRWHRLRYR